MGLQAGLLARSHSGRKEQRNTPGRLPHASGFRVSDAGKGQASSGKDRRRQPSRSPRCLLRETHPTHSHSGSKYGLSRSTDSFSSRFSLMWNYIRKSQTVSHHLHQRSASDNPKRPETMWGRLRPPVPTRGLGGSSFSANPQAQRLSPSGRGAITLACTFWALRGGHSARTAQPVLPATKLTSEALQTRGSFPPNKYAGEKELSWSRLELKWPFL